MLTSLPAVLLADDMGLGKTVQAIVAIARLAHAGELSRVLVVAPVGLLAHWRRSFRQFAPQLPAIRVAGPVGDRAWQWRSDHLVHIVGYETLRNDLAAARARPWDLVVLDEAQRIKNRETGVSRACKLLPRARAWALTGTPLENRVDDLASVLEFVSPNPDGQKQRSLSEGLSLLMAHRELQLRRRKQDVLTELPERTDIRLEVELTPAQRNSYQRLLKRGRLEIAELGEKATVLNVLELIMRLKQVCNFDPETGESAKLGDVGERLEELVGHGHRALVFSQFTSERYGVNGIANRLGRFRPLAYTGALGTTERELVIERFIRNGEHKALILSLRAGGQGLNLQTASYVFHFDRWWNPAVENQASDRVHRIGQTNAVTVYAYTTPDTVEERIEEILAQKRLLFAALVDRVSLDPRQVLTPEEIFGLVDLPAPRHLRERPSPPPRQEPVLAQLARRLEQEGWAVTEAAGRTGTGLVGRRHDEVGLETQLWIEALPKAKREIFAAVRERAPAEAEILATVDEPIDPEAVELAASYGIVLVAAAELEAKV